MAIKQGDKVRAEELLRKGADLDARDANGLPTRRVQLSYTVQLAVEVCQLTHGMFFCY